MSEPTGFKSSAAATPTIAPITGPHPNLDHGISLWLDEQIWGHRLWDAQSPWLVFLEFLTVAEACYRDHRLLEIGAPYPLSFRPQQRMHLRNILFNSDDMIRIAEEQPDSPAAWELWLARMAERAQGVPDRDFSYLKERFHSFEEFARVIGLIRASVVERGRNKRWSSRFVFPFGAQALYEDLNANEKTNKATREYINFGRTGELLYLMLCRSAHRDALIPVVTGMVAASNRWDRLVGLLQPGNPGDNATRGKSYLPYATHPVFDALAEDWLAVSRLVLPGFDAYPHYVSLAALHLMRYHILVAASWAEAGSQGVNNGIEVSPSAISASVHMICEIVAPRKTLVRELSLASYGRNDALSPRALEQFIDRFRQSEPWKRAAAEPGGFEACRNYLQKMLWWGQDYEGHSMCLRSH